jgi:hypothetical protein
MNNVIMFVIYMTKLNNVMHVCYISTWKNDKIKCMNNVMYVCYLHDKN